jgi:hypothetical protein
MLTVRLTAIINSDQNCYYIGADRVVTADPEEASRTRSVHCFRHAKEENRAHNDTGQMRFRSGSSHEEEI